MHRDTALPLSDNIFTTVHRFFRTLPLQYDRVKISTLLFESMGESANRIMRCVTMENRFRTRYEGIQHASGVGPLIHVSAEKGPRDREIALTSTFSSRRRPRLRGPLAKASVSRDECRSVPGRVLECLGNPGSGRSGAMGALAEFIAWFCFILFLRLFFQFVSSSSVSSLLWKVRFLGCPFVQAPSRVAEWIYMENMRFAWIKLDVFFIVYISRIC